MRLSIQNFFPAWGRGDQIIAGLAYLSPPRERVRVRG